MSKPKTKKVPLDKGLLLNLCYGNRTNARVLESVVAYWRTTTYEDGDYPIVRMTHESWAEKLGYSERTIRRAMKELTDLNLINRRTVRAKVGTGFVVCPSYRTQLMVCDFLIDGGRMPRTVPQHLIVGRNFMKVHLTRFDTNRATMEQMILTSVAGKAIEEGSLSRVVDLKITEELLAAGIVMMGGLAVSEEATLGRFRNGQNGRYLIHYRTLLTESSIMSPHTSKKNIPTLSAPKPGADLEGSPEKLQGVSEGLASGIKSLNHSPAILDKYAESGDLKIKSNVVAFPTPNPTPNQEVPVAKIADILAKHGVADKNDPNAPMDTFAALKPQYDETAWQKGLVSTWRDALIKGGFPVLSLFAKETKNLKDALVPFPPKDKLAVLEHVLVNWAAFVSFCKKGKYKFTLPAHPMPGAVVLCRNEMVLFWEARDGGPQAQAKVKSDMEGVTTAEMALAMLEAKKASGADAPPAAPQPIKKALKFTEPNMGKPPQVSQ